MKKIMTLTYGRACSCSTKRTSSFVARLTATFAAVLCCAMTTTMLTACGDDEVPNGAYYTYEVQQDILSSIGYTDEAKAIQQAFNQAIGYDGSMYKTHSKNIDNEMKAACEAVQKKYANVKSTYLIYHLIRITITTADAGFRNQETIATYQFGQALAKPYVTYSFGGNEDEAYAALEAKKSELSEDVYTASHKTLRTLLGIHKSTGSSTYTSKSAFENYFKDIFPKAYEENKGDEEYICGICDSIAAAHAEDVLAVEAIVTLSKTGLLTNKREEIWRKVFPANVK